MSEIIALLVRFVVAIEIIAASLSGGKLPATDPETNGTKEPEKKTSSRKPRQTRDDEADDAGEEPEKKTTARRTSSTKTSAADKKATSTRKSAKNDEPDLDELRDEIEQLASHIAKGKSDECANEFDDLLAEYDVRNVKKLHDDDVEEFHEKLKETVEKYYEAE